MFSFASIIEDIDAHIESYNWKTSNEQVLHGVLCRKDNRLILNVNSKELTEPANFDYIYREDDLGNRRTLYPYDTQDSKTIHPTELSESWPVEVFILIDKNQQDIPSLTNQTAFTYDSFLWGKVPETDEEWTEYDGYHERLKDLETTLGKVSVSLGIYNGHSNHPSMVERRMDKISITIQTDAPLPNDELLMWHTRFSHLLAFIHKEYVIPRSIRVGVASMLVPDLVRDYTEAKYAWRNPIGLSEFADLVCEILPTFVDKYDEISPFFEDLIQYYHDYPSNPPDKIQLLRLFASIEQCATYAQNKEKLLSKALSEEEKQREKEFKVLLKQIKSDGTIADSLKTYLQDKAKTFYVTSGSKRAPKNMINALSKLLQDKYEVFSYLTHITNVELILKMRNVVAHGFYDPKAEHEFYKRRDDFGQDIEQCLRMYVLHVLGASKPVILRHKDPLKARRFNSV